MTVIKIEIHPDYYYDGRQCGFQNGSDIALAIVEITDPRYTSESFADNF